MSLKVFRHEERETIFLCWLLIHRPLSTQPTRGARSAQIRLALLSSESQPSSSEARTQLTAFFQISAHASGAWRHPNTQVTIPIWDFYFDISEWHIFSAHAWTPELHLINQCAERKVLSLTKPKGKIYITKSLGNYIYIKYTWFGLVGFYGISTIVGYLMPKSFYSYISNMYDLVWLGFIAFQPVYVI